jgi:hypothetical protein
LKVSEKNNVFMKQGYFHGRKVLIATMHEKERVLGPILASVGLIPLTLSEINTDQFGTFSGEIQRLENPIETLRKKCDYAYSFDNCELIIASEGSFGAHPFIPFAHADEEILMLKDYSNDLEIVVKELSTETNFDGSTIQDLTALLTFAEKAGFPDHALILKTGNKLEKGIKDKKKLVEAFLKMQAFNGSEIVVETDMRAMHNPTRMKIIEKAADKLIKAMLSCCPMCQIPNYTVKNVLTGLPCALCGMPTNSIRAEVLHCDRCGASEENAVEKIAEDPMYCTYCNP